MNIQYLEIVTPDVDATCATLGELHGVTFGAPIEALGHARTAPLEGGGRVGVRAPMHASEAPVVRPYFATVDVESSAEQARELGADLAHPPLELPGEGTFAIYLQGGTHLGLWKD